MKRDDETNQNKRRQRYETLQSKREMRRLKKKDAITHRVIEGERCKELYNDFLIKYLIS